ncbi:MAG TPA: xylulokinase [Acidimicrobiales bacterium]
MTLVAGVDSSTSACKVEVRDADTGELVASGRAPHPPTTPPRSEQRPEDWWSAFETACAQAGVSGRNRPAAISVAGQQHGLVVLDRDGVVLRPAKLWNDTESAEDADALVAALGAEAWADACGSVPVASFTITKLRWLQRCEPDVFRRVALVLLPHDWLTRELTRRATTDRGDASGTGWWSPREERYRHDLLAVVDDSVAWEDRLPEVLPPAGVAGEWNGMLVGAGTGDNMAAALGLGLQAGDVALSLGTSGTAFCVSDRPAADASGVVAGFADATGRYLALVCTLNATKVTDAMARLLGVEATGLDALALGAAGGAGGVVLVPHLDGERTPNRPRATGTITGLRSDATRQQLARAAVEGVVCNLLEGAGELVRWEPRVAHGRVLVVGGGARSAAYRQVCADLTGRAVVVPDDGEPVARGAALQAAAALTRRSFDDIANDWGIGAASVVEPDPSVDGAAIRAAYADALEKAASA